MYLVEHCAASALIRKGSARLCNENVEMVLLRGLLLLAPPLLLDCGRAPSLKWSVTPPMGSRMLFVPELDLLRRLLALQVLPTRFDGLLL